VRNSFYIVCTIVLFSYSALGCKSVLINKSINQSISEIVGDSSPKPPLVDATGDNISRRTWIDRCRSCVRPGR